MKNKEREVIEMADLLLQRVIEGQPLVMTGMLDESMAKMYAATVNCLVSNTGQAVTVLHIPN
ncbi:hypothetical protein [Delftia acidovorans]|uniref:hypothetical protein n=1 Tax=Delftia acidovorans TaxID=80866 RepID=UPI0022AB9B32|nr:hypothetical protein [Delftia acidovorans]WAT88369.1 hypothetical protein O1V13_14295 [Delftia acidovorans]